jgi:hypothetical protein
MCFKWVINGNKYKENNPCVKDINDTTTRRSKEHQLIITIHEMEMSFF